MTASELALDGPAPIRGRLRPPGDKGISHRALLFAAMAEGPSRLTDLADGDDVARTRAVLEALGVRMTGGGDQPVVVHGAGVDALREPTGVLDCANSGTTMRLGVGLLAGRPFHAVLVGDDALSRRPMARVAEPVRAMGAHVDGRDGGDYAPLAVRGGGLVGRRHELRTASGQVKTALVLAGLQAEGVTEIVEPAASRDHTERLLEALGGPVTRPTPTTVAVRAGAPRPFELAVPGDVSSAAFFVVAAALTPGSALVVEDVGLNPTRIGFVGALQRMGADVTVDVREERLGEPVGELTVRAAPLHGAEVTVDEGSIDEVPALAIAAAFADGVTEFVSVGELRVKESDRLAALEQELTELGVGVEAGPDRLVVRGGTPRAATLKSHGDHRIAMAAAVAANAVSGASTVRGWAAVAVSYPRFADDLAALDASVRPVVAIDGPSGAGKSTVARGVAAALGFEMLDTGAMYRAVTLATLEDGVDVDDEAGCAALARRVTIEQHGATTRLDGRDVSAEIRGADVTAAVSSVSAHPGVRIVLVEHQRAWLAARPGGVVEGRDIGTVVFPDAAVKVFLTASEVERARRRRDEAQPSAEVGTVQAELEHRDHLDSTRATSPLQPAPDALRIDTTDRPVDEVVRHIVDAYQARTAAKR